MRKKLLASFMGLYAFIGFAQDRATTINELPKLSRILPTNPDFLKDYVSVQALANKGDIPSLLFLGQINLIGLGIEANENVAFQYYMKAAQLGNLSVEYHIRNAYMEGARCKIDFNKAMHWFRLFAEHRNEHAAYTIGYKCRKGFGVSWSATRLSKN